MSARAANHRFLVFRRFCIWPRWDWPFCSLKRWDRYDCLAPACAHCCGGCFPIVHRALCEAWLRSFAGCSFMAFVGSRGPFCCDLAPVGFLSLSWFLGFETPAGFLFFLCIAYLMGVSFLLSASLSRQSGRIKTLVQEVSLLKLQIEDTQKALALGDGPSDGTADGGDCRDKNQDE